MADAAIESALPEGVPAVEVRWHRIARSARPGSRQAAEVLTHAPARLAAGECHQDHLAGRLGRGQVEACRTLPYE